LVARVSVANVRLGDAAQTVWGRVVLPRAAQLTSSCLRAASLERRPTAKIARAVLLTGQAGARGTNAEGPNRQGALRSRVRGPLWPDSKV
jgi:hypothetical protein